MCVGSCRCFFFSPHLKDQFTHQSVPLTIRLQAAVFVVWRDVDLILKAEVVGQSVQDVNGVALVLFGLSQNILGHHYERLLLQGKDQSAWEQVSQAANQYCSQSSTTSPNYSSDHYTTKAHLKGWINVCESQVFQTKHLSPTGEIRCVVVWDTNSVYFNVHNRVWKLKNTKYHL